jgi:hypothetical protein
MEQSRRVWIAIGGIVVGALVIGTVAALTLGGGGKEHTITGVLEVQDPAAKVSGGACTLSSKFDAIHAGTPVHITDEKKTSLGSGELSPAKVLPGNKSGGCEFTFFVSNVAKADSYNIAVDDQGEVNYTYEALKDEGWAASLKIS